MRLDTGKFIVIAVLILIAFQWINNFRNSKKGINYLREIFKSLFIIYLSMVAVYTFGFFGVFYGINFNFIPFVETFKMFSGNFRVAVYQVGGNILMFVPFGFFLPLLYKKERKIINVIVTSFIFSMTIEVLQSVSGRAGDVDDLFFNTLGGVLGFLCYIIAEKLFKTIVKKIVVEKSFRKKELIPIVSLFLVAFTFSLFNVFVSINEGKKNIEDVAKEINGIGYEIKTEKEVDNIFYLLSENEDKEILLSKYEREKNKAVNYNERYILDNLSKEQDYKDEDGNFVYGISTNFEGNKLKSILLCLRGNIGDKVEIDFGEKKASFEIKEKYMIKNWDLSEEDIIYKKQEINIIKDNK
ncbi:MAG: VanZ family protein [Sarcina sp.]